MMVSLEGVHVVGCGVYFISSRYRNSHDGGKMLAGP